MYEYKFVKVKLSGFKLEPEEDYQAMVSNYAKEGWRLDRLHLVGQFFT